MSSGDISRREFLGAAAFATATLPALFNPANPLFAVGRLAEVPSYYAPPQSPRARLNFNLDWKFIREDVIGAEIPSFENGYILAWPNVAFSPGSLRAIARDREKVVAQHELTTTGEPAQIRLTPIVGPDGLKADGQDVLLLDVEVIDAKRQRVPTDDARIDFTMSGPGIWRRLQQW